MQYSRERSLTIRSRPALAHVLALAALLGGGAGAAAEPAPVRQLAVALAGAAPAADPHVIDLATRALACAQASGDVGAAHTLSVIDYSRPSTERRLWVFDLDRRELLFREWVAHGRNTGANVAAQFSNAPGSLMSSIGSFVTADTYTGHNGYSLRLKGLDAGFNDNALERAIVMHGAAYVSDAMIHSQGRLGRSFGCPAVRPAIARQLIDAIRGGSFVFAYYPDRNWLRHSYLLDGCSRATVAGGRAAPPAVGQAARSDRQAVAATTR
jgi:hypothetical protein